MEEVFKEETLQNVVEILFLGVLGGPSHVGTVKFFGEDFFGKSIFGHFFCPIFKTQNTLCENES
jgi:hypothetical protein